MGPHAFRVLRAAGALVLICAAGLPRSGSVPFSVRPFPFGPTRAAADDAAARGATVPAAFVVTTTDDDDDGQCDASHCSLREAINAANQHDGPDRVDFDIPEEDARCDAAGVCTIRPQAALPRLVDDETTIDGFTQSGALPNTNPFGQRINAVLKIVLDGGLIDPSRFPSGLSVAGTGNRVRGLVIHGFYEAISLQNAAETRIEGNFLGTDAAGATAAGNECSGIIVSGAVDRGSSNNVVGGAAPDARNLVSGNGCSGVELGPAGANVVEGNYIGTDASGTAAVRNRGSGVRVFNVSSDNRIGGAGEGAANLIAFNTRNGVTIEGGFGAAGNTITRNRIRSNDALGIALTNGGNDNLAAPAIGSAAATRVAGTACAGCVVEIFSDAADEGAIYEGTATADGAGSWAFDKPAGLSGPRVTATATDAQGNTSPFSAAVSLPVATPSATPTATSATPAASPTSTPTVTSLPTATPTAPACTGDCNGNGSVTVDELVRGVNIALGNSPLDVCAVFDRSNDGQVSVDELVRAVNAAQAGCPT